MRVTVDPTALAEWSVDARDAARRLATTTGELHAALGPMRSAWVGAAAEGFDRHIGRWRSATDDLLRTLGQLTTLVDTARANYAAAVEANIGIWAGADPGGGSGPAAVHAMSAGRPSAKINAETDDIRATVTALVSSADALGDAWGRLAGAVAGTGAMAGDDPAGGEIGRAVDSTSATCWQAWRATTIMAGAVAGGLAATGNNMIRAEADSTHGVAAAPDLITAAPAPVPSPTAPPSAVGDNGSRSYVQPLAASWPTASPERLRAAAGAWRASAESLRNVAGEATSAVSGLVGSNPDPTLEQMRAFTDRVFSLDPVAGLMGALAVACGDIAGACGALAAATERTRARMADAVAAALTGEEWYDPVAAVLDALITRGMARVVAAGGHVLGLAMELGWIQTDHAAAVRLIGVGVSPAAAERLARLATALVPPKPLDASTCAVMPPAGAVGMPVAEADRQALVVAAVAQGKKINPAEVLQIARAPDGRIIWLERGNENSGLGHILRAQRVSEFMARGVPTGDISRIAVRAVTEGLPIGRVGGGGVAYDLDVGGGRRAEIVVVVGSNGYVVTAYPLSRATKLQPMSTGENR